MSNLGKTLLIVNPTSKNGAGAKAGRFVYELLQINGVEVEMVLTSAPKHAVEIAYQAQGYQTILALGGDGVIHETANGLMKKSLEDRPVFGIIPVGSGNDYARTLDISEDVKTAVMQNLAAPIKPIDVGCCNGEFFVETLSFGLDAAIALATVERRVTTNKTGTRLYLEAGLDQLLHHLDTFQFTVAFDDREPISGDCIMMACQIGQTYGGGFHVCPQAIVDDGCFDICYARGHVSLPKAVYTFLKAKDGKHVNSDIVTFEKASKIHLEFDRRPPVQIDGEAHIADAYDISMNQQALRVLYNK